MLSRCSVFPYLRASRCCCQLVLKIQSHMKETDSEFSVNVMVLFTTRGLRTRVFMVSMEPHSI